MELDDTNDFGFSLVSQEEIESTKDSKAEEMYNAIDVFLTNLEAHPEKEYLHWPDRAMKVRAFREKLKHILTQ